MIVPERYVSYLDSLNTGNTPLLEEIENEAKADYVPIIRTSTQQFLKTILTIHKPQAILEVGTAVGFSSILMATYNPVPCKITTIENYDKRIPIALENFKRADLEKVITLKEGDAAEVLKTFTEDESFDFIFMDAAKGQYINFWPDVKRLIKKGGIVLSDNVLQDGDVIQSKYAVTRRNRTIHKRMRDYLYELTHDEDFVTTILPVGDGLAMSVRQ